MSFFNNKRLLFIIFVSFLLITLILGTIVMLREWPTILYLTHTTPSPTQKETEIITSLSQPSMSQNYQEILTKFKSVSKKSHTVEIGKCSPYPRIVQISSSDALRFTNSDSIEHSITLQNIDKLSVLPGKSVVVSFSEIDRVPLILGYGCDSKIVGAVYITF